MIDHSAKFDEEIINRYGLKLGKNVRAENVHDKLFEEILENPESLISIGGSALNTLRCTNVSNYSHSIC